MAGVVLPHYTPMAPMLVREPFHRDGWVYEEKVHGWRIVAYKDGDYDELGRRVAPTIPAGKELLGTLHHL